MIVAEAEAEEAYQRAGLAHAKMQAAMYKGLYDKLDAAIGRCLSSRSWSWAGPSQESG